jgi:hypothetical protein
METKQEREDALRAALFVPCESEDHLHRWIKIYLGLDLPNCIVCDDDVRNPPSNSSPMKLIWEMYSKAREGTDAKFTQVLGFAARDGFKTLSAAIMETLCIFHLKRDVGHLAALEVQAKNCQNYVGAFVNRPILREFLTSKNKRELEITRYENEDGHIISPIQFNALSEVEKMAYTPYTNSIKIVIATVEACNGLHVPFMVMDELDLADPAAFEEAKMISTESRDTMRQLPITFMTSTRKYSFGLVQKEIDNAHKSDLHVRHWNLIDVTRACEPERHLPNEPKIDIYYSESQLKAVPKEEWQALSEKEKEQYDHKEGYAGCLKNCSIFAQCQGRLAYKQTSKSKLLKSIDHTQTMFKKVSLDMAKAQLMCWKPSSEGLIYPNFQREIHMISAAKMAELVTGDPYPADFTKNNLIDLFKSLGAAFYCGLDHGFTHNFAVVTAALLGHILYVIDVISVKHLELQQKIDLCKEKIKHFQPTIFPDNAYPSDNKTFRRNGFKMVDFKKDVLMGVEAVRTRLAPGSGKIPSLYFLAGDDGVELLISRLLQYHWKVDTAGRLTDEPDSNDDDELDALRYLAQNVPLNKSKMVAHFGPQLPEPLAPIVDPNKDWMKRKIEELTGDDSENREISGRSGGFMWTF